MNKEDFFSGMMGRTKIFIPEEKLRNIQNKTFAIAGCGGVGTVIVETLARLGIEKFRLCDKDKFELSNMNRQIYALLDTLGQLKAEVCAKRIKEINPFAKTELILNEKLNKKNVEKLLKGADIVIRATDTISSALILHKTAKEYSIPLIEGHGFNKYGVKVRVFDYRQINQRSINEPFRFRILNKFSQKLIDATKKDLFEMSNEDLDNLDDPCSIQGSLNYVVTIAACLMISETIKLLTEQGKIYLYPQEIFLNLQTLQLKIQHKHCCMNLLNSIWKRRNEIWKNFVLLLKNNSH